MKYPCTKTIHLDLQTRIDHSLVLVTPLTSCPNSGTCSAPYSDSVLKQQGQLHQLHKDLIRQLQGLPPNVGTPTVFLLMCTLPVYAHLEAHAPLHSNNKTRSGQPLHRSHCKAPQTVGSQQ